MDLGMFREIIEAELRQDSRSEAWLAKQLGHQPVTFNRWINGDTRIPYDVVCDICNYLKFDKRKQVELFDYAGYPLPAWVRHLVYQQTPQSLLELAGNSDGVRRFYSTGELWKYSVERINSCTKTVCDLTWGIDVPSYSKEEDDIYFAYLKTISDACKRNVIYREVMTFANDPEHFIWRADSVLSQDLFTYNLRFYDLDLTTIPPLLQFTIFDETDMAVGLYRWPYLPVEGQILLNVSQPEIVHLFQDYFDTIWAGAKTIKEGDRVRHAAFEEIKKRYRDSGNS